jgi:hypothetical protein
MSEAIVRCNKPNQALQPTAPVRDVFDVDTHEQAGEFKEW